MNILDRIVAQKKEEVKAAQNRVSFNDLEKQVLFDRKPLLLADFLKDPQRNGIIAEFKRRSPSKGWIHEQAQVDEITQAYAAAGASAISVLTDTAFFGGSAEDLILARSVNQVPLLRKDFVIEEYQLWEAKAWGADIVLLIAAILTPAQLKNLAARARELGLNVLLEVHSLNELQKHLCAEVHAVGVNNRNLADFTVRLETSFELVNHIPDHFLKITESAIQDPSDVKRLKEAGFDGFLIGENFMKHEQPGEAMRLFSKEIR